MNIKPTFFTSDWHLGHEKSLVFDKRPFRDLTHMHETLITRYNSTVPESGICYFLGDIGNQTEVMAKVIKRLNGTKVLVLGNHDKGITTMYNVGFDVVTYVAAIYIGDHRINMTHCPYLGVHRENTSGMTGAGSGEDNWHGESREKHRRSAIKDDGNFLLHGHIHSRPDKPQSQKILGKQFDVGVVANNYAPVSLSTIESWVMTYGKSTSDRKTE